MKRLNRLLVSPPVSLALIVGLIFLYVSAWRATHIQLTDFVVFYSSARLLQAGENPYLLEAECREQARIRTDLCMPNPHFPVLLPLFSLVATANYAASYARWSVLLLVILSACSYLAYRLSGSIEASIYMVLFQPVLISVTQGNVSPFILLAVLWWIFLLRAKRDIWAGLALSIAVVKPQLVLVLAIPLALPRPKAFLGFCIGSILFALSGLALVGLDGYYELWNTLVRMTHGQVDGADPAKMYNVTGLFARAGLSRVWGWPVFAGAIVLTALLWRTGITLRKQMLAIVIALFAVPHLYAHDLALLAVPLMFFHPLAPVVATCLLLLFMAGGAQFLPVYLLMAFLGVYYATLLRDAPKETVNSS